MYIRIFRRLLWFMVIPVWALAAETIRFDHLTIPPAFSSNAVAYPTITSDHDDSITSVDSPCCTAVEIHMHEMDGSIMRMRRLDALPLKAKVPVVFEPGALHMMLIGVKHPLHPGDVVAMTFHFAHSADQKVLFTTQAPRLHD
jgi:copper(I)-binding protein